MKKSCKNGHPIGAKNTSGGYCTALHCAYEKLGAAREAKKAVMSRAVEVPLDMLNFPPGYKIPRTNKEKVADAAEAANTHQQVLLEQEAARHAALGLTPEQMNVKGAEAEKLALQILGDGVADAAAVIMHAVRFGSGKFALDAAQDLLDRTGHGKKEGPAIGNAPMLVINFSGELPWARKDVEKAQRVVDAEPAKSHDLPNPYAPPEEEPDDA